MKQAIKDYFKEKTNWQFLAFGVFIMCMKGCG